MINDAKSHTSFWQKVLKKIFFKDFYKKIDENTEILTSAVKNNEHTSEKIGQILKKNDEATQKIIKETEEHTIKQNTEFLEKITEKNNLSNKQLEESMFAQITQGEKSILETLQKYDNLNHTQHSHQLKTIHEKYLSLYGQKTLEHTKTINELNLKYLSQNKEVLSALNSHTIEEHKKEIKEFIEKISQIANENEQKLRNFTDENKKQSLEILKENRVHNKDFVIGFFDNNEKQFNKFMLQAKKQADQENLNYQKEKEFLLDNIEKTQKAYKDLQSQSKEQHNQLVGDFQKQHAETLDFQRTHITNLKSELHKSLDEQIVKFLQTSSRINNENNEKFQEKHKNELKEILEEISDNIQQSKKHNEDLLKQNKLQFEEFFADAQKESLIKIKENSIFSEETARKVFENTGKQLSKFLIGLSDQNKSVNDRILQHLSHTVDAKNTELLEKMSEKYEDQKSVIIKQNTELISQILSQSLQNQGTIKEKFRELVIYQYLSRFRENLTIIKTSLTILATLDSTQLKIFQNLYTQYNKKHSKVPILDVTQGIIVIKLLFPPFFQRILRDMKIFEKIIEDEDYTKMKENIEYCNYNMKNFSINRTKINTIKPKLDSHIEIVDNLLEKLISLD